jgi:hypothetical protein
MGVGAGRGGGRRGGGRRGGVVRRGVLRGVVAQGAEAGGQQALEGGEQLVGGLGLDRRIGAVLPGTLYGRILQTSSQTHFTGAFRRHTIRNGKARRQAPTQPIQPRRFSISFAGLTSLTSWTSMFNSFAHTDLQLRASLQLPGIRTSHSRAHFYQ